GELAWWAGGREGPAPSLQLPVASRSEAEARADLELSRESSSRQRVDEEEIRRPQIAGRIGEVRLVGDVERLEEQIDGPPFVRPHAVAGADVDLQRARPVGAVAPALVVDGDRVLPDAAVAAGRQRVDEHAIAVRVDVAVVDREGLP